MLICSLAVQSKLAVGRVNCNDLVDVYSSSDIIVVFEIPSITTQDQFGGVLDNPPLAEEIAFDPVLR
jgi:hypothetical protein